MNYSCNSRGKKESKSKKPKSAQAAAAAAEESGEEESSSEEEETKSVDTTSLPSPPKEDDPFTISFSAASVSKKSVDDEEEFTTVTHNEPTRKPALVPHPRRSSYLQFHKGYVYMYGGKYEDKNEREFTFNDMYRLSVKRMDEWTVLYEDKELVDEIKKAEAAERADDEDDDEEMATSDEDDDDEDMSIDAPAIEPNETSQMYFERTKDVWMTQATAEFPDEKSQKILTRMASELCTLFWTKFNSDSSNKKQ